MLITMNLNKKNSEVSIKTKSTPASLSFKGQPTKHTTVKWSFVTTLQLSHILLAFYNVGKVHYNWTGVRAAKLNKEN